MELPLLLLIPGGSVECKIFALRLPLLCRLSTEGKICSRSNKKPSLWVADIFWFTDVHLKCYFYRAVWHCRDLGAPVEPELCAQRSGEGLFCPGLALLHLLGQSIGFTPAWCCCCSAGWEASLHVTGMLFHLPPRAFWPRLNYFHFWCRMHDKKIKQPSCRSEMKCRA